ncbi:MULTISPECIES: RNA chaperone Hfq [Acidaminococcus]|jgi:host factor-I protein|uniref:RNA chaperone Hfq n=1 Tax=Acidaminococcus TaxID=904 RepID=UPI0008DA41E0|nr:MULTISPECIES: RNA chaperone Hfq [Acidaminococcus]MDO5598468.1 RNA chaperone Hfq [Acidaminococcus sp.]
MTTGNRPLNLQDSFLNKVRSEKKTIVIYLMNGFQVRGKVWGFDNFTVILESEGKQQLIYKHAISTIAPVENEAILVLKKGNDQGVSHE